jgi:hypothetical protein
MHSPVSLHAVAQAGHGGDRVSLCNPSIDVLPEYYEDVVVWEQIGLCGATADSLVTAAYRMLSRRSPVYSTEAT